MIYQALADLVLLVHASFIMFVVFGGVLALWKPWIVLLHMPALAWGAAVIGMGWTCPLTPSENTLRQMAGNNGYASGFIEHYLLVAIYPPGLTRQLQTLLAVLLIVANLVVYVLLYHRRRRQDSARPTHSSRTMQRRGASCLRKCSAANRPNTFLIRKRYAYSRRLRPCRLVFKRFHHRSR
ncbi:hypothetical protein CR155_08085 [Pollutimonas nitritireducens]|uniref:DUF2784 domain-containing protein n=1 Tax=Pollutimonas nitritireducens TaxID=2045209 RepID=A0A2N4UGD1_9BURK|nr:hypothetical protein CR155_08085 [Pollutimonas nitritireducens]